MDLANLFEKKGRLKKQNQETLKKNTKQSFFMHHVKSAEYLLQTEAKYLDCLVIKALADKTGHRSIDP